MKIAIYPGSFDPVTHGHLDVLERASRIFDQVVVAVSSDNSGKKTLFDCSQRLELIQENIKNFTNVSTESFSGLLVDYANKISKRFSSWFAGCI